MLIHSDHSGNGEEREKVKKEEERKEGLVG